MGFILEKTPEMGEYHAEVRSESFYISGEPSHAWVRVKNSSAEQADRLEGRLSYDDPRIEVSDSQTRPDGEGWTIRYIERRHAFFLYRDGSGQGTAEMLIEDIPKIRAVIDAVAAYVEWRRR